MATPMTLEGCAELRAEMDAGQRRDDVLARAGIGVDEWTVVQRDWLDKMGIDLERGRFELTNRYTRAFLERQRALTAAMPPPLEETAPIKRIVTARHDDDGTQTLPMPPLRGGAPSGVGPAALPFTPAGPSSLVSAASTSSTPLDARACSDAWSRRTPVDDGSAETGPMPPLRLPSNATTSAAFDPPDWASGTSTLGVSSLPKAALPFQPKPLVPPSTTTAHGSPRTEPAVPVASPKIPSDIVGSVALDLPDWAASTSRLDLSSVSRAALPFQPTPLTPSEILETPSDAAASAALDPLDWAASTSVLDLSSLPRTALPFDLTPRAPASATRTHGTSRTDPAAPAENLKISPAATASEALAPPDWASGTSVLDLSSIPRVALPFHHSPPAPTSATTTRSAPLANSNPAALSAGGPLRSDIAPAHIPHSAASPVKSGLSAPPALPSTRLPSSARLEPARSAAPVPMPSSFANDGLSLEQHASLSVEIAQNPSREADALSRYRITSERKAELDALWRTRFSADPTIEAKWWQAYRLYADFLATRRT
jgi:hypothetical protein